MLQPVCADQVDVVVQAGHQGRPPSCAALAVRACNLGTGLGTQLERNWTPVVADAAAAALRREGFSVKRRPADYAAHDRARAAVFLHSYHFAGENITRNEAEYYGFRKVDAPGRTLLIEFGEMTCPVQERWMAPRLQELGTQVARFIGAELRQ
jgi:hypothetical protein